ncbi:MAG TPA: cytochrome c [Steroidobacteraceae bacterium]|nr:cytochrome c [Steroidobacteraceae bacterium]
MNPRTAAFIAALWVTPLSFAVLLPAQAQDRGKEIFDTTCIACHGKDGKGVLPGTPNLRKVMAKRDEELVRNTLNGYQSPGSPLAMPAKGGNPSLTEADVRAVIQYMRSAFGK